ncbi:hypothetical protein [Dechloromonas sp. HYN0024]|uniref:hypothetical protein n=1 Tax=Dechloromonas sp. HYN0024 TaxID=2231055 RepID=UPI000E4347D8|nr:hypothetical protein [Dechloromonas sp. HYN0024]AXS81291.1 hypothetical protein HYN24_15365 [Dechloromonas sp. HYN0024]
MNTYLLSIVLLFAAALCQTLIGGFALKWSLQQQLPGNRRRMWIAFSIGALLLALHHSNTLSLAAKTGLYDFSQAVLALLGGLATAFAVYLLSCQKP